MLEHVKNPRQRRQSDTGKMSHFLTFNFGIAVLFMDFTGNSNMTIILFQFINQFLIQVLKLRSESFLRVATLFGNGVKNII